MRYRGKEREKKSNGHIMEIGLYSLSEQVEVFSIKKRHANHFLSILIEHLSGKSETNNFHLCCFYTIPNTSTYFHTLHFRWSNASCMEQEIDFQFF